MEKDEHGTIRFKENKIVRYLLDEGGIDLNKIATLSFSTEDREQFAQLIGYSLGGFGDLSYITDETYEAAKEMFINNESVDTGCNGFNFMDYDDLTEGYMFIQGSLVEVADNLTLINKEFHVTTQIVHRNINKMGVCDGATFLVYIKRR